MRSFNFIIILFVIISSLNSCKLTSKSAIMDKNENKITLIGNYESLKGVMNEVSCYCYNVGYLTTNDNSKIVLCFDELKDVDKVNCSSKLTVTGYYKTKKITSSLNNPCPSGEMEIFIVTSFSCK